MSICHRFVRRPNWSRSISRSSRSLARTAEYPTSPEMAVVPEFVMGIWFVKSWLVVDLVKMPVLMIELLPPLTKPLLEEKFSIRVPPFVKVLPVTLSILPFIPPFLPPLTLASVRPVSPNTAMNASANIQRFINISLAARSGSC